VWHLPPPPSSAGGSARAIVHGARLELLAPTRGGARCCCFVDLPGAPLAVGGEAGLELWHVEGAAASAKPADAARAALPFGDAGSVISLRCARAAPTTAAVSPTARSGGEPSQLASPGSAMARLVSVSTGPGGGVRLWDGNGALCAVVDDDATAGAPPRDAFFGMGGRLLLTLHGSHALRLHDVTAGGVAMSPARELSLGGRHTLSCCALSPDGEWVLALGLTALSAVELLAQKVQGGDSGAGGHVGLEPVHVRITNV
jgi:hypothetical protein